MRTPNFSSAFTTIVIIDSESMSRSSVKFLSGSTDSTGRPVSSFTISARPLRISCSLLAIRGAPSLVVQWCVPEGPVGRRGTVDGSGKLGRARSGQRDDLRGVRQPGAEADEQRDAAMRR